MMVAVQGGRGTGNTALAYHAKKLLALHEGDLPYVVRLELPCEFGHCCLWAGGKIFTGQVLGEVLGGLPPGGERSGEKLSPQGRGCSSSILVATGDRQLGIGRRRNCNCVP